MANRPRSLFLLLFLLLYLTRPAFVSSQVSTRDSLAVSMIFPSYSFQLPFADMKERFGISHTIGAGYTYMFKSRWLLTLDGNFLFGPEVKNRATILNGVLTPDGHVISEDGTYAQLAVTERGYNFWLRTGKLWPTRKQNPNTGFVAMAGAGFLQHKIRIDVSQNTAPQFRDDYKKGYDRMCNGPALNQYIGYQHIDPGKRLNFYAGLEFTEAFTRSRRAFYFSEKVKPDENRFDMLVGLRIGWLVPFYKKVGREYYYY